MRTTLPILVLAGCTNSLTTKVVERALDKRIGIDVTADFRDGLHLALCGAGGPMPSVKASGPCVAVVAGERLFIVDSGSGGVRNLGLMGYPTGKVESVFLTHFHSDHMDGLGELGTIRWVSNANKKPLPVYGPTGVERVVQGFNRAYSQDFVYRHAHHGDEIAALSGAGLEARSFASPAIGELAVLIDEPDLRVEALRVDHHPVSPAVGYRFTYKDRSLLITGDSAASANIAGFAKGVDLLVHDALSDRIVGLMHEAAERKGDRVIAKVTADIPSYHATPAEAAETAREARVGHLLYYHIVPPIMTRLQLPLFLDGADTIFADYTIGTDGTSVSLPSGTGEIAVFEAL